MNLLRLPSPVDQIFEKRLRDALPDRADRVLSAVEELRGGEINDNRFGHRMVGQGPRWQAIAGLFRSTCGRLGLSSNRDEPLNRDEYRPGGQQTLGF